MKYIIIILCLLNISGCTTYMNKYCIDHEFSVDRKVNIDPRYLLECDDLAVVTSEKPSFEDILVNVSINTNTFSICKQKQHDSILLLKKFANIKD
jgi:hypothetical protein